MVQSETDLLEQAHIRGHGIVNKLTYVRGKV